MSEQNKALVRRLYEDHWTKKNEALVGEVFASNVSLNTPDGVVRGLNEALSFLRGYASSFPDFVSTIEDLVAEGDKVVARWTFTGTHTGAMGDIPASGKRVKETGIGIYRVVAGKIAEGNLTWNKHSLLKQIGALN